MELQELRQLTEALAGLAHAQSGVQEARQAAFEATLIALHQRDPSLLAAIQTHLDGMAPLARGNLQPEAEQAFDVTIEGLQRTLSLMRSI